MRLLFRVVGCAGTADLAATTLLGEQVIESVSVGDGQQFELETSVVHPDEWEEERPRLIRENNWEDSAGKLNDVIISTYTGDVLGGLSEWKEMVRRMYALELDAGKGHIDAVAREMLQLCDMERKASLERARAALRAGEHELTLSMLEGAAKSLLRAEPVLEVASRVRSQFSGVKGHIRAVRTVAGLSGHASTGVELERWKFQLVTCLHAPFRRSPGEESETRSLLESSALQTALAATSATLGPHVHTEAFSEITPALSVLAFARSFLGQPTPAQFEVFAPQPPGQASAVGPDDERDISGDDEDEDDSGVFVEPNEESLFRLVELVAPAFSRTLTPDEETVVLDALDTADQNEWRGIIERALSDAKLVASFVALNPVVAMTLLPVVGAGHRQGDIGDLQEPVDEDETEDGGPDLSALASLPRGILEALASAVGTDQASVGLVSTLQESGAFTVADNATLLGQWFRGFSERLAACEAAGHAPRAAWGEPHVPSEGASQASVTPNGGPEEGGDGLQDAENDQDDVASKEADEDEKNEDLQARAEFDALCLPLVRELRRIAVPLESGVQACGTDSDVVSAWKTAAQGLSNSSEGLEGRFAGESLLRGFLRTVGLGEGNEADPEFDDEDEIAEEEEGFLEEDAEEQIDDVPAVPSKWDPSFIASELQRACHVLLSTMRAVADVTVFQRQQIDKAKADMARAIGRIKGDEVRYKRGLDTVQRLLGAGDQVVTPRIVRRLQFIEHLEGL
jgi:hypothetical protein